MNANAYGVALNRLLYLNLEAFIQESFLFKLHLDDFWSINVSLGTKGRGWGGGGRGRSVGLLYCFNTHWSISYKPT